MISLIAKTNCFICIHLNRSKICDLILIDSFAKYKWFPVQYMIKKSFLSIDGTDIQGHNESQNNSKDRMLHITHSY